MSASLALGREDAAKLGRDFAYPVRFCGREDRDLWVWTQSLARRPARLAVGQNHAVAAMGFDDPVAELFLIEARVEAAAREEFVVGAVLDDRAVLDGEDDIGVSDRREAVRWLSWSGVG